MIVMALIHSIILQGGPWPEQQGQATGADRVHDPRLHLHDGLVPGQEGLR